MGMMVQKTENGFTPDGINWDQPLPGFKNITLMCGKSWTDKSIMKYHKKDTKIIINHNKREIHAGIYIITLTRISHPISSQSQD